MRGPRKNKSPPEGGVELAQVRGGPRATDRHRVRGDGSGYDPGERSGCFLHLGFFALRPWCRILVQGDRPGPITNPAPLTGFQRHQQQRKNYECADDERQIDGFNSTHHEPPAPRVSPSIAQRRDAALDISQADMRQGVAGRRRRSYAEKAACSGHKGDEIS